MPVLAAVREREARRIRKPAGRAVHNLRHQREREQRPRADAGDQHQRGEVLGTAIGDGGQRLAEAPQVDVFGAHVVMRGHPQLRQSGDRRLRPAAREADHLAALARFGYSDIHRRSFRPATLFDTID